MQCHFGNISCVFGVYAFKTGFTCRIIEGEAPCPARRKTAIRKCRPSGLGALDKRAVAALLGINEVAFRSLADNRLQISQD